MNKDAFIERINRLFKQKNKKHHSLTMYGALIIGCGFVLVAFKNNHEQGFGVALTMLILYIMLSKLPPKLFPLDTVLHEITHLICSFGILVLYNISPDKGINQAINYLTGLLAMLACFVFVKGFRLSLLSVTMLMLLSAGLMALPVVLGHEMNGARAWVSVFGMNFQPSEIVKIFLIIILSFFLSRRQIYPAILFSLGSLLMLLLQKDLGTALLYYFVILMLLYVSTGSLWLSITGVAGFFGAAAFGYSMFSHVKKRVRIWINPWADPRGEGYQIVQSLVAIANGGPFGLGLGVGNAKTIPAHDTDFIFPVILNEFGYLFGACLILLYALIFIKGITISRQCRHRYHALLALGCSLFIAFQTFVIIGGNIKLIPLTGVTLPFISYGGSSLVSSLSLVGILHGIHHINHESLKDDEALSTKAY